MDFEKFLLIEICTDASVVEGIKSLLRIFLIIIFLAVNLEVPQFVSLLVFRHYSQPVAQLVFLQVLFRQVLEVSIQTNFF